MNMRWGKGKGGFGHSNRKTQGAGNAAPVANVILDNSWRIQPSTITVSGTTSDASNLTNLQQAKNDNSWPVVAHAAGSTAVVTMTLPVGGIAAPGGILAYTMPTGTPANLTILIEKSTDSGASWTTIPQTLAQSGSPLVNTADQVFDLPVSNAGDMIRFSQSTSSGGGSFRIKMHQLQTDPMKNPIFGIAGMSVTVLLTGLGQIYDDIQARQPGFDPVFLVSARSGAKLADMLTEQFQGVFQSRTYIKRIIHDIGPNDFLESATPLASRGGTVIADKTAATQAILDWATTNGRTLYEVVPGFFDPSDTTAGFPATYNGLTFTINQSAVTESGAGVSISNQANGQRAYNNTIYMPKIAGLANSYDSSINAGRFDGYALFIYTWRSTYNVTQGGGQTSGVHPTGLGQSTYCVHIGDAALYAAGITKNHIIKRAIDSFTIVGGISSTIKNRLHLAVTSMDDNMDSATRTAWRAAIDALSSTYIEPAGQTAPSSLANMVASFDFDDFTKLYTDDAGTALAADYDLIKLVKSKVGSGTLGNTSATTSLPYKQPIIRSDRLNSRPALKFDATNTVYTSDATTGAALNSAAQPFILAWVATAGYGASSGGIQVAIRNGTTSVLQAAFGSNRATKLTLTGNSLTSTTESTGPAYGDVCVYVLTYDGTTLNLRRNGVQTATRAWSKPAWTADNLYVAFLGSKPQKALGVHLVGSWSGSDLTALENRLRAQAGV